MKKCLSCRKTIAAAAVECPYCGAAVIEETLICPACGVENSLYASRCSQCSQHFFDDGEEAAAGSIFENKFIDKLEQDIADRFSKALETRLLNEHATALHPLYRARITESGFSENLAFRFGQLAQEVSALGADFRTRPVRQLLSLAFEDLLDYFLIRYGSDLNEVAFPEVVLSYQGKSLRDIELKRMVLDYLDFDREDLACYTDFVKMPSSKLKNAADAFLFPKKEEKLFFICNTSLLGHCKTGFAMTSKCLYWKTELEPAQRVYYHKLEAVKRTDEWITINGIFFHATKPINLKMLRLLSRIKLLLEDSSGL